MYSTTLKVRVPEELKMAIYQAAQSNNLDMSSFVRLVLTKATQPRYIPNKKTLEAIREVEEGGGIQANNINDFWDNIFQ